jgi:protein TonB
VVGLSLESTSEAGQGPAFAVGDTLAGSTAATAATRKPPAVADSPAGPNRIARGAPRPGSVLTPPRRLHEVKPHYPDALRAAGVEADVLLVVSLDAGGRVLSVTVGRGSGDPAFDESARAAARQEQFSPALRDGVPVPTTFSFTTHFRLDTP